MEENEEAMLVPIAVLPMPDGSGCGELTLWEGNGAVLLRPWVLMDLGTLRPVLPAAADALWALADSLELAWLAEAAIDVETLSGA